MRRMQLVAPELKAVQAEVQGRPRAPAARDARPVQAPRGQPARLLLPVPAPDPVLHRRLLPAARRCLRGGRATRAAPRSTSSSSPTSSVPPEGAVKWVLIVLFISTTVLTFLYTTATTQTTTGPQRYIFLALPLLFAPIIASQPAGLAVYWITTNIWSLGQQVVVQRIMPMPTPPTPEEVAAAKPPPQAAAKEEETQVSRAPSRRAAGAGRGRCWRRSSTRSTSTPRSWSRSAPDEIAARVEGEELGLLIGRRGQTIDAVQLLCYRVAFRGQGERKRVSVDAAGYRERRRETVERQADRAADRALESGKEIELEPMTPTERKVVHDRLADRSGARDLQRGRGARALRDRGAAGRRLKRTPSSAAASDRSSELLASDPASLSSVRDPEEAWRAHVRDSLTGLEPVGSPARARRRRRRRRVPGAGARRGAAGDAGRPDRVGRPQVRLHRARDRRGRARQRPRRVRALRGLGAAPPPAGGREDYEVVTARAVGRLSTLAELASPLLRDGRGARRLEGAARSGRGGGARAGRRAARHEGSRRCAPSAPRRASSTATSTWSERRARRRPGCRGGPGWRRSDRSERDPERAGARLAATAGSKVGSMGAVYALANQKGGVGKTTTAVNLAACAGGRGPPGAARRPRPAVQRNGCAWARPRRVPLLVRMPDAARPRSRSRPARRAPTTSGSCPPTASSPAPRSSCRGSTATSAGCATASARCASASRSPCSTARPRSGRLTVNALAAADRVIVPVQAEYLALEGLVQFLETLDLVRRGLNPALILTGVADHHARRAHPPRPGRRGGAAPAFRRTGVRYRDPEKRPHRRGPEPRRAGDRARSRLARRARRTGRWRPSSPRARPATTAVAA